ncbi:MAG: NADH-quinone oxidoreductase subunit J [cyanobacterium endosymbiont of Epithemia adnata isolate EadnSB Bon19]|uniref:NADH-quinone oxidoreductase subunit J n=1 Tax=cyanobacterium endosymbiont of Epithemia turgida TaxID=718217 RepID=UPI0004D110D3|nr:NADH-quinone oxidoreductase subunit J [cyanobacterium endosymbiont of Epithemia turgida]BAP18152.1 NADH dehydrogenase subunit J [cyanobacterium endosymbiont of Epithemia turgida isolate EtSB Lake Yunoko]
MNLAEGIQIVSFAILATMVIGTSIGVVLLSNIVYSAFLLGGVFISISGIYILLNADFVAVAQILIYVGAINVLILFAIMLVNKREDFSALPRHWIRKGLTALICGGIFILLTTMIFVTPWSINPPSSQVIDNTIVEIGKHFFSDFLLPFELASVLLLIAMIGAIILARRDIIPELLDSQEEIETALELPERPSELEVRELALSKESKQ